MERTPGRNRESPRHRLCPWDRQYEKRLVWTFVSRPLRPERGLQVEEVMCGCGNGPERYTPLLPTVLNPR